MTTLLRALSALLDDIKKVKSLKLPNTKNSIFFGSKSDLEYITSTSQFGSDKEIDFDIQRVRPLSSIPINLHFALKRFRIVKDRKQHLAQTSELDCVTMVRSFHFFHTVINN